MFWSHKDHHQVVSYLMINLEVTAILSLLTYCNTQQDAHREDRVIGFTLFFWGGGGG
jgi:hypothetical protein